MLSAADQLELKDVLVRSGGGEPWRNVLKRDTCAYCGSRMTGKRDGQALFPTIDHIEPRRHKVHKARDKGKRGMNRGPGDTTNLIGSCSRCNNKKGTTPLLFFMLEKRETKNWRKLDVPTRFGV